MLALVKAILSENCYSIDICFFVFFFYLQELAVCLNSIATLNVGFFLLLNVAKIVLFFEKIQSTYNYYGKPLSILYYYFTSQLYNYFNSDFTVFNQINSAKTVKY